jgi:hypothetical protein
MSVFNLIVSLCIAIAFIACNQARKQEETVDFCQTTQYYHSLEESNRIVFKKVIEEYHIDSEPANYLNRGIIDLYDIVDKTTEGLLNQSGGYDPESLELINCLDTVVTEKVLKQFELEKKLSQKLQELSNKTPDDSSSLERITLKRIENCLYPILQKESIRTGSITMAKLYLDLIIVQNRLLVTELEYYEQLRDINSSQ